MASVVNQPAKYDAIVVGAGHNGLVAACYLAGAGLNVCVLERYHEVGGATISEETIPGFKLSTGSYVLSLAPRKIFDELGAWEGIELLERNPRFFAPFPDGSSLTYWNDHGKWLESIRKVNPKDAEAYDVYDNAVEVACSVMDKYILRRPPSWDDVASNFRTPEEQKIFQMFYLGAVADIAEYYFDSDQMQATVSSSGIIGTFRGPRDPGTGYVKLYHSMGMATGHRGRWAYVRGAMGAITQALRKIAERRGVTIRTNANVQQIVVKNGRAAGVLLDSGEELALRHRPLECRSQADLPSLVEERDLPADYRRSISNIKIESPVIKINMAVRELPKFLALPDDQQLQGRHRRPLHRPEHRLHPEGLLRREVGKPAEHPFMNIHMQSAVDRTVAPGDMHTISIFTQYFPYTLAEGTWDERRDEIAQNVIRRFAKFAPNMPDAIVGMQVLTPPDIEARFGDDRRTHLPRRAGAGAGLRHAACTRQLVLRGADRRPVPLRLRRLAGRLRDGRAWT